MSSVEQELRDWQESSAGEVADALGALLRSDRSRLAYWPGPASPTPQIEALDAPGDAVAVAVEASKQAIHARVCIGWVMTAEGVTESAWLIDSDGSLLDPARERLGAIGYLGIELRSTELARWTPTGSLADLGAAPHERNYVP